MPTLNERCKILRSLNRVYVIEIVLLLVPRLKILRGLSIWDLGFRILRNKEAQEYNSSSQETNHNTILAYEWTSKFGPHPRNHALVLAGD